VAEPPSEMRGRVPPRGRTGDVDGRDLDEATSTPGGGARDGRAAPNRRRVWVATRDDEPPSRTSPTVRLDLLQIVAWVVGLTLVVLSLVAIARAGFGELGLFEPVVEVGSLSTSPLLALLWLLVGVLLIAAATGEVDERGLRITGVVLAVTGLVWAVEPGAFEPYLGITSRSGVALLAEGVALTAASFVPPLAARRPGV